jgi:nucleotide-binding universal stress UspA family protein
MNAFAPQRILVAIDFSDISTRALRAAVLWAQRYRSELIVLHAEEPPPVVPDLAVQRYIGELTEATREAAARQLAECVLLNVPLDLAAAHELIAGTPSDVIEQQAVARQVDLVVLGTHGRGGLSRLLLGSVAERTLRMAQRPTLIVRRLHSEETAGDEVPRIGHILCPVNYSEVARAALGHACSIARSFGARLTVVFALEQQDVTAENLQHADERLRSWLPEASPADCQMRPLVRHGDAAEHVINLARETAADLIVIGAQHRRFADTTVLGVTTVRVTRHAPCPVLVVPRPSRE